MTAVLILALVSGYAPSAGGINCDSNCSVTASGAPPGPRIAACGYGWELGQRLYVPGYGPVTCGDRFATREDAAALGLPLYAMDVWFASAHAANEWGVRQMAVAQLFEE